MSQCLDSARVLALVFMFGAFPALAESGEGARAATNGINALQGFFIGVDAAYNHSSVKNDETGGVAIQFDSNEKMDVSGLGKIEKKRVHVDPSVNVGYSHFFDDWYLGIAGDISFNNNRRSFVITDPDPNGNEGYETKISGVSYGIKVKGGYYLSELNSVVYGIAGVKWRGVSYTRYGNGRLFDSGAKLRAPAFLLGLGFEKPVCKRLSLSLEYEYSWRASSSGTFWDNSVTSIDFPVRQKFREHALKVGVKCHV